MNSHDRRTVNRAWPHCVEIETDDNRYYDITEWLLKNFGSCSFKRRSMPRWCWRPAHYELSGFAQVQVGITIFFRKERDYMAFLLRWEQ